MTSVTSILSFRLGDISLEMMLAFLVTFIIALLILGVVVIKKKVQADDDLPAYEVTGRVIEKTTEQDGVAGVMTFTVEWIVVEDEKGNRNKYRNTQTNKIFVSTGDRCRMVVRGNTIYEYTRV